MVPRIREAGQGFQEWLQKHQNHSPNAPTTVPGSGKRRNTAMSHFLFPFPWAGLFGKVQVSKDGALRMRCRCARPGAPLWWRGACSTGVGMDQSANDHEDRERSLQFSERLGNLVELPGKNLVTFRPVINQMPKNSSLYFSVLCIIDGYICLCNE